MRLINEFWILACLASCGMRSTAGSGTESIGVFAAASLTPIVEQFAADRASDSPNLKLNFAASSTLARQIESGAEADVFLSAHTEWIEWLSAQDLIEPGSVLDFARGELVWIVHADADETESFEFDENVDLASHANGLLAIGDPAHVPVGRYAKQALLKLNVWDQLSSRIISTVDAPSALRLVELGEASVGIVYASDALLSDSIVIRARFPMELCQPIRYQAALIRGASDASRSFIEQLNSPTTAASLESLGFIPIKP